MWFAALVVVITGVTVGSLGFEAAYAIAKYANLVILVGSSPQKFVQTSLTIQNWGSD